MKLFIAGIKHSGKSTFAPMLAEDLALEHADLDDLVLDMTGAESARSFYREKGKEAFMAAELEALAEYDRGREGYVVSLGGGAADNAPLMDFIRENGKLVYLRRAEKDLLERILRKGVPPFLDENDVEGSFHALFGRRDSIYSKAADLEVDLGPYGDKNETALKVVQAVRRAFF